MECQDSVCLEVVCECLLRSGKVWFMTLANTLAAQKALSVLATSLTRLKEPDTFNGLCEGDTEMRPLAYKDTLR